MLADGMASYENTGKAIRPSPASYKDDNTWLKEVDSLALCNVQQNLNKTYAEFFKQDKLYYSDKTLKRCKRQNREPSFYDLEKHPNFKSRKNTNWHSYTTNNQKGTIAIVDSKYIRLPKTGLVRCKFHRQIPKKHIIKSVTISKSATGKYYISILTEYENDISVIIPVNSTGLDYNMAELFVSDTGANPGFEPFYRNAKAKLAYEQQKLSRMVIGSNNYNKQKRRISILHDKIANQRKDFLHKQSLSIAKNYDLVCVEDLNMKVMSQTKHYGTGVHDNGWGMFTEFLEYKLYDRGKHFIKIGKYFPSTQLCSTQGCDYSNGGLAPNIREWYCPKCNVIHHRDINAAINIRNEGYRLYLDKQKAPA